jgi:hypothetical protein
MAGYERVVGGPAAKVGAAGRRVRVAYRQAGFADRLVPAQLAEPERKDVVDDVGAEQLVHPVKLGAVHQVSSGAQVDDDGVVVRDDVVRVRERQAVNRLLSWARSSSSRPDPISTRSCSRTVRKNLSIFPRPAG